MNRKEEPATFRIDFRVNRRHKKKLQEIASRHNLTCSEVLRQFIVKYNLGAVPTKVEIMITPELKAKLKLIVKKEGKKASVVLKDFIKNYSLDD